jgi:hypothetical protein
MVSCRNQTVTAHAMEPLPPAGSVLRSELDPSSRPPGSPAGTVLVVLQRGHGAEASDTPAGQPQSRRPLYLGLGNGTLASVMEAALNTLIKDHNDARKATKARRKADEIADRFPDTDVWALACAVEEAPSVCGGRQMAIAIASELRRRAAVGVRTWPPLHIVRNPRVDQFPNAVTVRRFDDQWTVEVVEDGVIMQRLFDRPEFALEFEARQRARLGLAKPEPT